MLWAIMRRPAFAAANCAYPGLPRRLADAPVKMTVPWPKGTSRRAASRPTRKPAKHPTRQNSSKAGGDLAEVDVLVVADVEDNEIGWLEARTGCHGAIEQTRDIAFTGRIRHDRFGAASGRDNRAYDQLDLGRGSAGDENVMTLPGKAPGGGRTQSVLGAGADDNRGGFAHEMTPMFVITG
jgi:hypothetical protein